MNSLYIGASGLYATNESLTLTASNLANAASPGFLAQRSVMASFPNGTVARTAPGPVVIGGAAEGVAMMDTVNTGQSPVVPSGQMTDLALSGNGFFQVQTPSGIAYTRDGRFTRNAQGQLVTAGGDRVLGRNGQPLVVGTGPFTVDTKGNVSRGTTPIGQLALASLPAQGLKSVGQNLYQSATPKAYAGQVQQGAYNASGVNLAQQAVDLMQAEGRYQALAQSVNVSSGQLKSATSLGLLA